MENISPDNMVYWQWGFVELNATIVFTLVVDLVLVLGAWLVTRRLTSGARMSRGQNLLEVVVSMIRSQIEEVSHDEGARYLPFIGTLFLFIFTCNFLAIVPGYQPPTGSLSTTAALALIVFLAVHFYGIASGGPIGYLKRYLHPSVVMLPFNIIGELSRTLALAVRLFGNIMSGTLIVGILLSLTPLFVPVVMNAFGLLVGTIQAYIFTILAMVYIASAVRVRQREPEESQPSEQQEQGG